jgi:hypothetical protein
MPAVPLLLRRLIEMGLAMVPEVSGQRPS